ncbi:toxin-antitoxin system HicB family antitoxin [Sphingomonas jaspsi]|uniref:toxin-antitoxin system HicB family antitoxin n=1 Tax=Sphingomonas jaspsi TaxID=392409 RepID=UPI0004B34CA7|nr:toxin-antitoxin system HicB family antitoxin [Sphingomonas jaspsi]
MSKKTHRSFTLRVDTDFYLTLAASAQAEGIPLNQLANRLLRLGMDKHVSLEKAITSLLLDRMVDDPELKAAIAAQVQA